MILIGVSGLLVVFALVPWVESLLLLRILLTVGGLFWACININSYPFIVSTGSEDSIGTRTGMYYLVSSLAAISSPPLLGKLIDGMGYSILFYCAAGSMLARADLRAHDPASGNGKPCKLADRFRQLVLADLIFDNRRFGSC